jgi:ATP-dependent Clp protease adaptor protein ClpS
MSKSDSQVVEMTEIKMATPKKYCAIIHNDDTTTFDFVIFILNEIYKKPVNESIQLAMTTHETGSAVVMKGLRSYLETLSDEALKLARQYGFEEFTITNEPE